MRTLTLQWCWGLTTVFAALLFAYAARAGEPDFVPSPDLLAAAKKEGKIVLYTANFFDTEQAVATRFCERFPGIKIDIVRAPSGQLITRIKTEAAANRMTADVIDISDRQQARTMMKLFRAVCATERRRLSGGNAHGRSSRAAVRQRLDHSVQLRARYEVSQVVGRSGETRIRQAASGANRDRLRRRPVHPGHVRTQSVGRGLLDEAGGSQADAVSSHAPMVDAMIRGEIAIAPLVTNLAIPLATQGAPLKWLFASEGVPVTVFSAGIAKSAIHPNAARLFLDWALSREGQALMVELGSFSSMIQAPMPPGVDAKAIKSWYPDDAEIEKISKPWTDDWNRIYNYRQ